MTELLTAAQMRAIEQAAIESGKVTGLDLMERAGRGVVEAVFEEWPDLAMTPQRAVVLCGPGNNGGDGFVVARLLKDWGWQVEVYLCGDAGKLPPDAKVNYERWAGGVHPLPVLQSHLDGTNLVVDALFGTGLTRPLDVDPFEGTAVLMTLASQNTHWLAVDVPSGLCADSGRRLGRCFAADLTVSFQTGKLGHVLSEGPERCGRLRIKDIGLDNWLEPAARLEVLDREPVNLTVARSKEVHKPSGAGGHKYDHGHAFVLSGGAGKTGAARLAARGALRIGAGLVTLGVPGSAQMEVASQITALMLTRVEDDEGLAKVLDDARLNALCLGPGLGLARARDLVPVALAGAGQTAHPKRSVVLDADALSAFADKPEQLFGMLHEGCVLTPHGGEFARLFPDIAAKLTMSATKGPAFSKVDATRAAAARAGCIVLFKGPDTVIAAPDGRCSINAALYERAVPWLATAGSGDVLAGFITGLLARGFAPMQAAETAAWVHVECARTFGAGLIAEDLPEILPHVLRETGL